jgi:hypothetical protein
MIKRLPRRCSPRSDVSFLMYQFENLKIYQCHYERHVELDSTSHNSKIPHQVRNDIEEKSYKG